MLVPEAFPDYCNITLLLTGPICKLLRKSSVVITVPGPYTVPTTLRIKTPSIRPDCDTQHDLIVIPSATIFTCMLSTEMLSFIMLSVVLNIAMVRVMASMYYKVFYKIIEFLQNIFWTGFQTTPS